MNKKKPASLAAGADLRRRAEARLRQPPGIHRAAGKDPRSAFDTVRLLHELEVHQVELEMQNAELQLARDRMEPLLEKYTDLYDFAPVGYFSLDEAGRIREVNLTGAALLGVDRSRLINRPLPQLVEVSGRPDFLAFLKRVFAGNRKEVCEAALLREDGTTFWAGFHGAAAISVSGLDKWCRVAVSDITSLKQAEEAQRRVDVLGSANLKLRQEIVRREQVEKSLKKSEQHQRRLLAQSHLMQQQLRHLSRQILQAQEEERRNISRELHDVIAQTLTGINIRLATLKQAAGRNSTDFEHTISATQKLVEKSVDIVHQFARDLRPAVLDDLGLIPALHTFMKNFTTRTGIRTHLTAFAGVAQLEPARRTVLFRVAQEALTNVARHAHASRAQVTIEKQPGGVCLKIEDDGQSFDVDRILQRKGGKHLGLLGMRERVEMVGGCFHVESAPGRGTLVRAGIPLAERQRGKDGKLPPLVKFICCRAACPKRVVKIPLLKSAGIKLESL